MNRLASITVPVATINAVSVSRADPKLLKDGAFLNGALTARLVRTALTAVAIAALTLPIAAPAQAKMHLEDIAL